MHQAHLLIVDGEPSRTPDLGTVMGNEGWEVAWVQGSSGLTAGKDLPDVVLFDPARITGDGIALLKALKALNADLPLVALGGTESQADWAAVSGLDPKTLHRMGREISIQAWPATLRSCLGGFGPGAQKFTTEDLFGDILAEMHGEEPAPGPAPVKAVDPPVATVPPPAPPPAAVVPAAQVIPAILPEFKPPILTGTVPPAPASPGKDFTLSDISGINDPFMVFQSPAPTPPVPEPVAPPAPAWPAAAEPSADDSMEEFGNYYLLEKVAVGGMAELFKARQRGVHDFEKIVAIKRILPHLSDNDEFVRMFIDEAKLAAQLTHPNIVQIFDLGKAMGFYYIAMEFVDGRDLRSLLRKVREYRLPVPEPIAAAVTMKVASALDYAHRKRGINDKELKLVHRDISPQNIIISYEGAVKLVDFGIAKAATKSTQTMAGALKGKLLYMSPEQALGQSLDGRSDIYSLGLVLFELLTGERCFQADSELGVLEKVRMGKVADVRVVNPSISQEMAAVVGKALNKDVDHRYVSARFLERDLKNLLVKNHNEPNEHDVAEYVNAVLKGSQAQLEALLQQRYPAPDPEPPPAAAPPPVPLPPSLVSPPSPAPMRSREPLPLPPPVAEVPKRQPFWLIPALLAVLAAVAWVAFKIYK